MAKAETQESPAELVKVTPLQIEQAYAAILEGDVLPDYADPEVVAKAIAERIRDADTFESAFAPQQKLTSWADALMGQAVLVTDLHLNRSTIEGTGPSVYAVVDLIRPDTGEAITVSCGGRNVLVQLVKLIEKGWTDRPVRLVNKDTAQGYTVLWLEAA